MTGGPDGGQSAAARGFRRRRRRALYAGTRLGRQELDGELIEDVAGALWTRALIESGSGDASIRSGRTNVCRRVVIGVDPPASAGGDACGIVVCGLGADGIGYVLGRSQRSRG